MNNFLSANEFKILHFSEQNSCIDGKKIKNFEIFEINKKFFK